MNRTIIAIAAIAILRLAGFSLERAETPLRDQTQTELRTTLQRMENRIQMLETSQEGPCMEKFSNRISDIQNNIITLRDRSTITPADLTALGYAFEKLEQTFRDVRKIDTRFRRIEKRVEEVNTMIQDLEGEHFQKMDALVDRVSALLQKAREKRSECDIRGAVRIIEEIEAIGQKARNEIRKEFSDGRQAEQYIRRNENILEKAGSRVTGEEETRILELARDLHEKSKAALGEKDFQKAWHTAVACRESLMDLARDILTPEEREKARDKVEIFYTKTGKILDKAEMAAQNSGNEQLGEIVASARNELEQARQLHQSGQDTKAMLHLRKARRIAEKIIGTAKNANDVSGLIENLDQRYQRVGRLIKGSEDDEAIKAYENASRHLDAAKSAQAGGKKSEAAKEARLAVRLLGKSLHAGIKNDPEVAGEVTEELQRVREKISDDLGQVKGSGNAAAEKAARQALAELSRAKALAAEKNYKKALRHLFKASSLSDRAVNLLNGRSNPELEEDTDIDTGVDDQGETGK